MNCVSCNAKLSWIGPKRLKPDGNPEDMCFTCLRVAILAANDQDHLFFERDYHHSHITENFGIYTHLDEEDEEQY